MLLDLFFAMFLPCAGMISLFAIYLFLLWCSARNRNGDAAADTEKKTGLSKSEIEKIPKATGQCLVLGSECAVCLEDIGDEEPVRMLPACNHGFHLECADLWIAKHPVCPVCRAKLDPQILLVLPPNQDDSPC